MNNKEILHPEFWEQIDNQKAMLDDKVRTSAYMAAIFKHVNSNITVLEIGCGTGILTFFAAKAGGKMVHTVEFSKTLLEHAQVAARRNHLDKRINFIHNDIFKVKLDQKVDILIHEQIGAFFWDEDMLRKVTYARKNLLKAGGTLLPAKADLYLVPVNYTEQFFLNNWDNIYGFDLSNFKKAHLKQLRNQVLSPIKMNWAERDPYLADPLVISSVDFSRTDQVPKKIHAQFSIKTKGLVCTGFLGFFKIYLDDEIYFSTEPSRSYVTSWSQFYLPILNQELVHTGDIVTIDLKPSVDPSKWRWAASYSNVKASTVSK